MTLTPITFSPEHYHLNLIPFLWLGNENINRIELIESIGNVLMFIPLGLFIPTVFEKYRKFFSTVVAVFIISFSIEVLQCFMGRIADIDDLIVNLLGGMMGYGIFKVFNHLFNSKTWWVKFIGMHNERKM